MVFDAVLGREWRQERIAGASKQGPSHYYIIIMYHANFELLNTFYTLFCSELILEITPRYLY